LLSVLGFESRDSLNQFTASARRAAKGTGEKLVILILAPICPETSSMSGDKQKQPLFQLTLATGEQRRETSCDVAMLCESYCLKDGSQQPENNQAKYHKNNGIEHGLVHFGSCCSSRTSKA
jgi:hypothetical protein